jgi:hypothetical protein
MHQVRTITLAVLILLLILACANAIHGFVSPPYTDQQIQASVVDTWQVEALTTTVAIALSTASILFALLLAYKSTSAVEHRLAAAAVVFAVSVAAVTVFNHVALNKRVGQLTGQSFARFYGLF